jgi:soluble lytic murein transglycosylase-like protein
MTRYTTAQLIQRIQTTAAAFGIDPTIAVYQLKQESGQFNPYYIYGPGKSSAGAMGLAQFIPATGARYGLTTPADFYDPDKILIAWGNYMSDLLRIFNGRYDLALAGYNWGEGSRNSTGRNDRTPLYQALDSGNPVLNYSIPAQTRTYINIIMGNAGINPTAYPGNAPAILPAPDDTTPSATTDSNPTVDLVDSGQDSPNWAALAAIAAVVIWVFW